MMLGEVDGLIGSAKFQVDKELKGVPLACSAKNL
jgi:hypothetical protein